MTRELVSSVIDLSEEDAVILGDFAASISSINSDTDLRALRLDWFRFQVFKTSILPYSFRPTLSVLADSYRFISLYSINKWVVLQI